MIPGLYSLRFMRKSHTISAKWEINCFCSLYYFVGYTKRKIKSRTQECNVQKDTCTPMFTEALFTIGRTWKQPKCPSTEEWIKMWYICTMEYYSAIKRNEIGSFVETRMDPETVIQSAVSQKEKNKYRILTYICGIWKNWYRRSYLQNRNRDTDIENKHMDTKGERGGGGMNWEIGTDIYTVLILCIK